MNTALIVVSILVGVGCLWLFFGFMAKWLEDCKHVLVPGETNCLKCKKDLTELTAQEAADLAAGTHLQVKARRDRRESSDCSGGTTTRVGTDGGCLRG